MVLFFKTQGVIIDAANLIEVCPLLWVQRNINLHITGTLSCLLAACLYVSFTIQSLFTFVNGGK